MLCNPELHRHKRPIPTSVYTPDPGELQRRAQGAWTSGGSQALGSGQPRWTGRAWGDQNTHGTHKGGQPALTWWAGAVGWPGPVGTEALGGGSTGAKLMAGSGKAAVEAEGGRWVGQSLTGPGCREHTEPRLATTIRPTTKNTLTIFRDPPLIPYVCHPADTFLRQFIRSKM